MYYHYTNISVCVLGSRLPRGCFSQLQLFVGTIQNDPACPPQRGGGGGIRPSASLGGTEGIFRNDNVWVESDRII